jgi:hypothetical protein
MTAAVTTLAILCAAQFVVLSWLWWRFADAAFRYAQCNEQRRELRGELSRYECEKALEVLARDTGRWPIAQDDLQRIDDHMKAKVQIRGEWWTFASDDAAAAWGRIRKALDCGSVDGKGHGG